MKPYEKQEFDTITATAVKNVEQFRYNASTLYAAYTKSERKLLRRARPLATFYMRYRDLYQPTVKELARKKPSDDIKSALSKGLIIGNTMAATLAKDLYDNRHNALLTETIAMLPRRSRRHAARILHLPSEQIDSLLYSYHQTTLYHDVAKQLHIAINDPNAPIIARIMTSWRIRRDRQKTVHSEQKQVTAINRELHKIDDKQGTLLRRIIHNDLELVTLLALKNDFAKKVSGSSGRQQLEKFEKTTSKFVKQQTDSYAEQHPRATLKDIANKKHDIEQLLQDICMLNNTERNQLLLTFSDYSHLYTKREAILAARRARDEFINR